MALKSSISRAQLQISDLDRQYYASHQLTLARHPSETDQRLMVRVLAFALFADERLEFGKGLSSEEPALWRREMDGEITQWIELGQPDEAQVRRAAGRARQVVIVSYSGRGASLWWEKTGPALARIKNLTVLDVPVHSAEELATLAQRTIDLSVLISEGELQLSHAEGTVSVLPTVRMRP